MRTGALSLLLIAALLGSPSLARASNDECYGTQERELGLGDYSCDYRPGGFGHRCSLAFAYRGSDGRDYMATAGHCAFPAAGEFGEYAWEPGAGRPAVDPFGRPFGEFAYAITTERAPHRDFGLIRLDEGIPFSPRMYHWGGPVGLFDEIVAPPEPIGLKHYGQGIGVSAALPHRRLVSLGMPFAPEAYGLGFAIFGDSGSPVITDDGRAVGVVTSAGVIAGIPPQGPVAGTVVIERLGPAIARAQELTGVTYVLQTAELVDDALL